jgi:four helix bundle suffix protein
MIPVKVDRVDGGERLIPAHGGYQNLKSFQVAQVVYDVTVRFCDRYIDPKSRTHDQMVQAARSGKQNIAEGSMASGTSKKTELKLTNVARASLGELRLDYGDFSRERGLPEWERKDPRREDLIARRPRTADEVAQWARDVRKREKSTKSTASRKSTQSTPTSYPEIAANGVLALIAVATELLKRQLAALEKAFLEEGGFTERLYRVRTERRSRGEVR